MTTLLGLLDKYVLAPVLSQAARELMRTAWEKAHHRSWEGMYLDAFEAAVDEVRPRLAAYAEGGEVALDRSALSKALHRDLGTAVDTLPLSRLSNGEFAAELVRAMEERSVLVIGGHNLSSADYAQLVHNLVKHATTLFREAILADEHAFARAVLKEELTNQAVLQEVRVYLQDRFDLVVDEFDTIKSKLDRLSQQGTDKQAVILAERVQHLGGVLTATLEEILGRIGTIAPSATAVRPRPDGIPVAPTIYAPRLDLVNELSAKLENVTCLALVDGPGKGKTQLARAISEASGLRSTWWVSLRDQEGIGAHLHLELQLVHWLVSLKDDKRPWDQYASGQLGCAELAKLICESIDGSGLLIIDNLPDSLHDGLLFENLGSVAAVFGQYGVKLVTTGQRPLPVSLQTQLGAALSITTVPLFSKHDIRNMLKSAQAPEQMREDNVITFILATTQGHPSLVGATVHWLRQHEWRLGEEEWTALLHGESAEDVRRHERRRMVRLLDDRSRELLYRLSLLWEEFDRTLALSIGAVPPPVEHPGESLDELTGPWLDRIQGGQYEVTPLVRHAGQQNLPEQAQERVHRAVADYYLSEPTIDASRASTVALHLWGAGDYHGFATFLIQLMISAKTRAQAKYIEWASWLISPGVEWPTELNLDMRIMLRAAQVRTRILTGGDTARLNEDLEKLMAKAGPENSMAVIFAHLNTGPLLVDGDVPAEVRMQKAMRAVALLRESQVVSEKDFPCKFEEIVWFSIMGLETPEQLRQFVLEFRQMTDEERRRLLDADLAIEGISHLMDRIWSHEADKPAEEQDWDSVLKLLDEVEDLASLTDTVALGVARARATAVVLADYLHQPDAALAVLEAVAHPTDPDLSFLVYYTGGCVLFDAGRLAEAVRRLDAASAAGGHAFSVYRFEAKRYAAIAQSSLGRWDDAKHRCIEVMHLAADTPEFLTYERLEMMGELAYIHWAAGNRQKACAAMCGFVTGLVARDDVANPRFREGFNKAGHALGWFLPIAITAQPPETTKSGEAYTPVEAGFFAIRRERLGLHVPVLGFSKGLLLALLGALAAALGLPGMARKIYRWAQSVARGEAANELFLAFLDCQLAPIVARFGLASEAIDLALRGLKAVAVPGKTLRGLDADMLDRPVSLQDNWLSLSSEERRTAERQFFLGMVFGPAFAELLGADVSRDELERNLAAWQHAVSKQLQAFEDPQFCVEVVQFFKKLAVLWPDASLRDQDVDVPGDEPLLKALWYLVRSRQRDTKLEDSLGMQAVAVDFLLRNMTVGTHMLAGVTAFLRRFWVDIANTRAFALNSPGMFRQELLRLGPRQGVRASVEVLNSARRAVGVSLPKEISTRFREASESGIW